jgi:hypothetical protein
LKEEELSADIARTRASALLEQSSERFDRFAFAARALELVRLERTRVVLCEGHARVRIESGRQWGGARGPDGTAIDRWAMLSIPPRASRRAIALAVAELAPREPAAYVMDVLLHDAASSAA